MGRGKEAKLKEIIISIDELLDLLENYAHFELEEKDTITKAQIVTNNTLIFTIQKGE